MTASSRVPLTLPPWRWIFVTGVGMVAIGAAAAANPALIAAVLLGLALVAATIYSPGIVFAAYLWVPPMYKATLQPYVPIDLTVLLAVLSSVQGIYILIARPRLGPLALWLLLGVVVVLGSLWSVVPFLGRDQAVQWVILETLPLLAVYRVASSDRHVREFVWATFAAGLGIVILGLVSLADSSLVVLGANPLAIERGALFVPIVLWGMWGPFLVLGVPAIVVALSTTERGPLLAVIATGAVMWFAQARREGRLPVWAVISAGLLGVAVVAALQLGIVDTGAFGRFGQLFGGNDINATTRASLYGVAARVFLAHPVIGVGTAGFTPFAAPFLPAATDVGSLYPHNMVLQFAAEFGLLGLVCVASFLYVVWRSPRPSTWPWRVVTLLAVSTLLAAMTSGSIYDNRGLWGLLLLMAVAPAPALSTRSPT